MKIDWDKEPIGFGTCLIRETPRVDFCGDEQVGKRYLMESSDKKPKFPLA